MKRLKSLKDKTITEYRQAENLQLSQSNSNNGDVVDSLDLYKIQTYKMNTNEKVSLSNDIVSQDNFSKGVVNFFFYYYNFQ